jgi:hypothetical protein
MVDSDLTPVWAWGPIPYRKGSCRLAHVEPTGMPLIQLGVLEKVPTAVSSGSGCLESERQFRANRSNLSRSVKKQNISEMQGVNALVNRLEM